jgi:hypothetical protein
MLAAKELRSAHRASQDIITRMVTPFLEEVHEKAQ